MRHRRTVAILVVGSALLALAGAWWWAREGGTAEQDGRDVTFWVRDAESGAGLPGATVTLPDRQLQTGLDGRVRAQLLGAAGVQVRASATGYIAAEALLDPGSRTEQVLLLRPRVKRDDAIVSRVPSLVVDTSGHPVAGASATLVAVALDPLAEPDPTRGPIPLRVLASARTSAEGSYLLDIGELAPGREMRLLITAEGFRPYAASVGALAHLYGRRDQLVPGGRWLTVRVVDGDTGEWLPAARALCRGESEDSPFLVMMEGATRQGWRIRAADGEVLACMGWAPSYFSSNITVHPGKEDVEIALGKAAGWVHGTVRSSESKPAAGAQVTVSSESGVLQVTTDARGLYRVEPVSISGTVVMRVSQDEDEGVLFLSSITDMKGSSGATFDVEREKGGIRVDVELQKSASLCGSVVNTARAPVPGVKLTASSEPFYPPPVVRRGQTEAAGTYCLHVRPDVKYAVTALHPDYATVMKRMILVGRDGATVDFVLSEKHSLSGVVVNTRSQPLPGAWVAVERVDTSESKGLRAKDDGTFLVEDILPGKYRLSARRGPHAHAGMPVDVEVFEGEDKTGVVVMAAGSGSISGRVTSGRARVRLLELQYVGAADSRQSRVMVASDGSYRLEGLEPATYEVQAWAEGYAAQSRQTVRVEDDQETRGVDWNFARGHRVAGRVVREPSGSPVPGATVSYLRVSDTPGGPKKRVNSTSWSGARTTGSNGEFELEALEPADYLVEASAEGMARRSLVVSLTGDVEGLSLSMAAGGIVAIRMKDEQGAPVVRRACWVWGKKYRQPVLNLVTDQEGMCLFERLEPGEYVAQGSFVRNGELVYAEREVTVVDGKSAVVDLTPATGIIPEWH